MFGEIKVEWKTVIIDEIEQLLLLLLVETKYLIILSVRWEAQKRSREILFTWAPKKRKKLAKNRQQQFKKKNVFSF